MLYFYTTLNSELYMRNNYFSGVSTEQGGTYIVICDKVVLENEVFDNTDHFGFNLYAMYNVNTLIMNNVTVRNVHGVGINLEGSCVLTI